MNNNSQDKNSQISNSPAQEDNNSKLREQRKEAIKKAIAEGTYEVDTDKVAQALDEKLFRK